MKESIFKRIASPAATIADVTEMMIEQFEHFHASGKWPEVYNAFTQRWSISSYEKALGIAWKANKPPESR